MIKNVIFDVGNVLVDFRWRALMEDLGLPKELQPIFEKSAFTNPWWGELDLGVMDENDVLEKLREENKEYLEEFNLVWDNRDKLVEPYKYAVPWIDSLKKQGLKVYLLSNYPKNMFTLHTECGAFPFIDHVDGKVVSGFVKMVKPNADIYEHLLKEYDLKAEECVFLDDRQDNVEGARALGIKGIIVKSYEQANAELKELLGK